MDGNFYCDLVEPFIVSDLGQVTLAATDKAVYTPSAVPVFGGQYWRRPGKKLLIKMYGKMTTGLTPGNLQWDIYYGSGADATGTILVSSAAVALQASQTNVTWDLELFIRCITTGNVGTLEVLGKFNANPGLVLTTAQPVYIPASGAGPSGAIDLTAANIISPQFKRSGSTGELLTVQELSIIALN